VTAVPQERDEEKKAATFLPRERPLPGAWRSNAFRMMARHGMERVRQIAHGRQLLDRLGGESEVGARRTGRSACATKSFARGRLRAVLLIALAQRFVSEDPHFAKTAKDGAPGKPATIAALVVDREEGPRVSRCAHERWCLR
jgi:hypothetical protein